MILRANGDFQGGTRVYSQPHVAAVPPIAINLRHACSRASCARTDGVLVKIQISFFVKAPVDKG
jgi:hypothetical protein